jgi:outer membrane protein assembly factor BamE (lipoprotein component of BamABCDE complex)
MKQMSKCTTTILASILVALCLTSCTPEKVVEVVREVEPVREVVIREEPRENIILEDELVAMMNDHLYGINSLI